MVLERSLYNIKNLLGFQKVISVAVLDLILGKTNAEYAQVEEDSHHPKIT